MRIFRKTAFTLLEVMVALAIIAITLGAIIENTTSSNRNAQYLRDKTVAGWVAMNQITLVRAKRQWSSVSNKHGNVEMAGQEWLWKMKILKTDNNDMRRLEVEVFSEQDEEVPLARVTGFLGKL